MRRCFHKSSGYDIDNLGNVDDVEEFIGKELEKRTEYLLGGTSKNLKDRLRQILCAWPHSMYE